MNDKKEDKVQDKKEDVEVSKWFGLFHASSVNGTAMLISAVIASYFSVFMTDTMLLPAATASAIFFIAFVWDAINDPIMGIIADRTKTKFGRYRPYFIIAPILLTIFATLIWVNPDLSTKGKAIYTLICYIGYGMTVTLYTMPQMAVLPAVIKEEKERTRIVALGGVFVSIMFAIGSTFTNPIVSFFEGTLGFSNGYIPFMLICGLLSFISFWGLFATSKERYLSYSPTKKERGSVLKELKVVFKHKELTPFLLLWFFGALSYGLMFATSVYYMLYYIQRPDLIPVYMGVISVGAIVSMAVVMPLALKVLKTPKKVLVVTQVSGAILYTLLFFFGSSSLVFLFVGSFLATSVISLINALVNVYVNDAIDYILFMDGNSANGLISSVKGFAQKCASTITNSGILFLLGLSGYIAGAVGGQGEATLVTLNLLRFGIPAVLAVIIVICLQFNPVDKHRDEIEKMKDLINAKERD